MFQSCVQNKNNFIVRALDIFIWFSHAFSTLTLPIKITNRKRCAISPLHQIPYSSRRNMMPILDHADPRCRRISIIMHENGIRPTAISHHGTITWRIKTRHAVSVVYLSEKAEVPLWISAASFQDVSYNPDAAVYHSFQVKLWRLIKESNN